MDPVIGFALRHAIQLAVIGLGRVLLEVAEDEERAVFRGGQRSSDARAILVAGGLRSNVHSNPDAVRLMLELHSRNNAGRTKATSRTLTMWGMCRTIPVGTPLPDYQRRSMLNITTSQRLITCVRNAIMILIGRRWDEVEVF